MKKIIRFKEILLESEMVIPDMDTLKAMYGEELGDQSPHVYRMRYKADFERGKFKDEVSNNVTIEDINRISNIQKELTPKVNELIMVTLKKGENEFCDKLNTLIAEYQHLLPVVPEGAKVVDIRTADDSLRR